MLDRAKGEKSKVLIATSSWEQHGHKTLFALIDTSAEPSTAFGTRELGARKMWFKRVLPSG
jgi:NaMN:DMB phosphoribosyltransferase